MIRVHLNIYKIDTQASILGLNIKYRYQKFPHSQKSTFPNNIHNALQGIYTDLSGEDIKGCHM